MRHNRRPARSHGDATNGTGPGPYRTGQVAACGADRRAKRGASPCLRARAARSAGPRGHADAAERGAPSGRSGIGAPAGAVTATIPARAQVCAG